MKILVDIGHPAHIHYFKNCARILIAKGYQFLFVVRERDSTIELIQSTGFDYVSRGKGGKGLLRKLLAIPKIDYIVYRIAKEFEPDIFLSFSSPYAAHVATLMRKPHIAFDDSEHAILGQWMYRPFTDIVLSPSCYNAKIWKNQYLFSSYMELCYLHPNYYTPNPGILDQLKISRDEKYCVLRLISWDANHDIGQHGLYYSDKIRIVKELSKMCKVYISSEGELPNELERYKLPIHPSQLHDALSYASLYIGEGGTTASESAVLGTPAIRVNSINNGLFEDEYKYGLLVTMMDVNEIIRKAKEILSQDKDLYHKRREKLIKEKIDPTAFMVWLLENYPNSKEIIKTNPDFQNKLTNNEIQAN